MCLAYQWEVRINRTIDEIGELALRYVRDELTTLDAIVSKISGDADDLRKKIEVCRNSGRIRHPS